MERFYLFFKRISFVLFLSLSVHFVLGCSDDLVPTPAMDAITNGNAGKRAVITAPLNITASQGEKQKISLSWDSVSLATRYDIYAADTPFEEFVQIGETAKTVFSYENLASGVNKYIKICAVDYAGTCSTFSDYVLGSTLAQPLISDIVGVSGNEDNAVIVYWYMENAEKYRSELQYTVICSDSSGKTIFTETVAADSLPDTSLTIEELNANETYLYTVEAFLSSNEKAIEKSVSVDSETARRLRPNPPENLSATEGSSVEAVTLTFSLPSKVDILTSANTYTQYPLYFKIYRRIAGSGSDWTTVVSHLYYNGSTTKPASFDDYNEGDKISWENKVGTNANEIKRGVQYEYKVQSYADNTTRIVTSDRSTSIVTGWAAAIPSIEATATLVKNEAESDEAQSAYTSATVSFDATWETFGKDSEWNFILMESCASSFENLESGTLINSYTLYQNLDEVIPIEYTLPGKNGYYQYTLYIVEAANVKELGGNPTSEQLKTLAENSFIQVSAPSTIFLTDVIEKPDLSSFKVEDGFTNKNILTWTVEDDCTYKLKRTTLDSNGTPVLNSTITKEVNSGSYTDEDAIISGESYSYTLYAIKSESTFPSAAITAKTLGTPSPQFDLNSLDYTSITVTWAEVQKAALYEVTLSTDSSWSCEIDANKITETVGAKIESGIITYKISEPKGYKDATLSGSDWTLTVKASSEVEANSDDSFRISSASTTVRTIGPANTKLSASKAEKSDQITVAWNKVEGAQGYALERIRYSIPSDGNINEEKIDLFYISAENASISCNETSISDKNIISVETTDEKFTFIDKQPQASLSTGVGYESSQNLISTGVPYKYTVLPVLSANDAKQTENFVVKYENIDSISKTGSTQGFGHNVTASKADFTNKIKIIWNKPYGADNLRPVVYKRQQGTSEWTTTEQLASDKETWEENITDTKLYEYAVNYGTATFSKAYTSILESTKTNSGEQANIGYAFRVTNESLTAVQPTSSNETFSETVKWSLYGTGTDSRKVKPDSYTIYSKNLNNSDKWFEVATISADGTVTPLPNNKDWYDVTMTAGDEENKNSLTITPNGILTGQTRLLREGGTTNTATTGTHDGLLKVQRDYKHYYKLVMSRESETEGMVSFTIGDDDSVYTYRKISDDEFCKNISLIIADAICQAGLSTPSTGSKDNTCTGNTGAFHSIRYFWSNDYAWGTDRANYQHIFHDLPGNRNSDFASAYTINLATVKGENSAQSENLVHLTWGTIKVSHESNLPSYTGYCIISAGKANATNIAKNPGATWDCTIQYSHTSSEPNDTQKITVNTSFPNDASYNTNYDTYYTAPGNETEFKKWIPLDLGSDYGDKYTTYTEKRTLYTGTWWEVR